MSPKAAMSSTFINRHLSSSTPSASLSVSSRPSDAHIRAFHQSLPHYSPTPLISLPSLATRLGVSHVLIKDESLRHGLPSFKIMGISWAVNRELHRHLALADKPDLSMSDLGVAARESQITIVCATDGNCGRANARVGKGWLGLPVVVFVPEFVDVGTRDLIEGEGAEVRVVEAGDYDDAIAAARDFVEKDQVKRILVMDHAWEGYEEVPAWVTEGYSTILSELDDQIPPLLPPDIPARPTHAFVSVGVGSWAQAVTSHFQSSGTNHDTTPVKIIAAEPTQASCLQHSLRHGVITPLSTKTLAPTIMAGMNCGTVSTLAWPILKSGVAAAVSVSDWEAHCAVGELRDAGSHGLRTRAVVRGGAGGGNGREGESAKVEVGPCGAATWSAAKRCCGVDGDDGEGKGMREELGLGPDSVVLLFSSEGRRDYEIPNAES